MTRPDAELIEAFIDGEGTAFRSLYEKYYSLAVGIARSRLSDVQLTEDAAQEAFAIAYRTVATLQNKERFPQWLGTICRRTASRIADAKDADESLSSSDQHEPTNDPNLAALKQQVQEALEELDATTREIVLLHYFSRMSYEEIATAVDLTTQAIHGRLQRARRTLRKILQPTETDK